MPRDLDFDTPCAQPQPVLKVDPKSLPTHTQRARTPHLARIAAPALVVILAGLATGCGSSMSDIDAQVEKLIGRRTARLDPQATTARTDPNLDLNLDIARRQPLDTDAQGSTDKHPETTNKPASELLFKPADEARNVSARLGEFSRQALGQSISSTNLGDAPNLLSLEIDLEQAFKLAQSTARDFRSAEEDYILAAIRLLVEQHRWTPRLSNNTSVTVDGTSDNGNYQSAVRVINDLRVTQRLPFGGQVEAGWVFNATEQLRKQATGRYTNSSELILRGNIPLLRDAGLIAQEGLIQSERDLVYQARTFERFRRQLLVQIAAEYFALVQTQARIANSESQLQSLRILSEGTFERVKAGRKPPFEQAIAENSLLTAESSLAGLRDSYILQLDRFKVRLGLDINRPLKVKPLSFDITEPAVAIDEATALALDYRLDLQNRRDQLEDSRRAIANARNQLLPNLDLAAGVGVPTDRGIQQPGLEFDPEDLTYTGSVTLGLPLDREIERLSLRQTIISLQRAKRDYDRVRDEIVVSVRSAIRGIDLARFQIVLAEQGVKIAQRRREEQNLKADEVQPQEIVDSEIALVEARNARDQARTDLRNAVLNYLLESDQLRVARDGTLERLPGMKPKTDTTPQPTPNFESP